MADKAKHSQAQHFAKIQDVQNRAVKARLKSAKIRSRVAKVVC